MDLELNDKLACVTGSSRGIGRAIAESLLREGARVMITGRGADDLDRTHEEFSERWGESRVSKFQGDLTEERTIQRCVEVLYETWEGLDILVANIGSGRSQTGSDLRAEEWMRMLSLNLVSAALIANQVVSLLQARGGGSITFVGSLAGLEVLPAPIPYASAKAGLVALGKMLSRQLASRQIRVNIVAPGNILFPGGVWQHKLEENLQGVTAYLETEVPMKRLGTPAEVADTVAFVSSSRASFITGACVVVDGGQSKGW